MLEILSLKKQKPDIQKKGKGHSEASWKHAKSKTQQEKNVLQHHIWHQGLLVALLRIQQSWVSQT